MPCWPCALLGSASLNTKSLLVLSVRCMNISIYVPIKLCTVGCSSRIQTSSQHRAIVRTTCAAHVPYVAFFSQGVFSSYKPTKRFGLRFLGKSLMRRTGFPSSIVDSSEGHFFRVLQSSQTRGGTSTLAHIN